MAPESVDAVVAVCVYEVQSTFGSRGGRAALSWCLQELRDRVMFEASNDPLTTEKRMKILDRITSLVCNAYCVMQRAILPGFLRREEMPDMWRLSIMAYRLNEEDSDGYDEEDSNLSREVPRIPVFDHIW